MKIGAIGDDLVRSYEELVAFCAGYMDGAVGAAPDRRTFLQRRDPPNTWLASGGNSHCSAGERVIRLTRRAGRHRSTIAGALAKSMAPWTRASALKRLRLSHWRRLTRANSFALSEGSGA